MPLYEYQCTDCGTVSEVMQRMSEPPLTTCEKCGGALKKLISAPAFQFKGSGWYVTDYAGKGGEDKTKSSDNDSASSGSETKDSKKSDSGDASSSDSSSSTSSKTSGSSEKTPTKTKSERTLSNS